MTTSATCESGFNSSNHTDNGTDCVNEATVSDIPHSLLVWRVVIQVGFVSFLIIFGCLGNAVSVTVLHKDNDRKNATNWLLQMLAVVDTLYLITCVFIQPLKVIHDDTNWFPQLRRAFPYMEPHMWAFASITQTITVWMVLLVTVDRYIAICHPLNSNLRSIDRCKIAVVITIFCAILYNIPRFLEREIVMKTSCETGERVVHVQRSDLRNSKTYYLVYKFIFYLFFRSLGPLLALIFLNVRLIMALSTVRRRQKSMTKRHRNRENITLMLVVVVTIFIFCEIPSLILRLLVSGREYKWFKIELLPLQYANCISNALLTINSSVNFLIYCLIGKKFRKILLNMYCGGAGGNLVEVSETEPLTMKSTVNKSRIEHKSVAAPDTPDIANSVRL